MLGLRASFCSRVKPAQSLYGKIFSGIWSTAPHP